MRITATSRNAEAQADELTAELASFYWRAHDERLAETGFVSIARQLPGLIRQAVRLGWQANRRDTAATIGLNLVSGVLTGFALLATTGVLEALFAAGPTPQRVRAALPSLIAVAAAVAARAGLQAAAGWAQARLKPQVDRVVEIRLLDLTTQVELAAFDDAAFYDAMQRARDRGLYSAPQVVTNVLDCVTGAAGIAAAASVVAVLQPILLILLLIAELPGGWAAVRAARIGYITNFALADSHRRKWMLADLMAERRTAAEMRSFTLRHFMLARVARLAAYARDAEIEAAGRAGPHPAGRGGGGRRRHRRCIYRARDLAGRRRDAARLRGYRGPGDPFRAGVPGHAAVRGEPVLRGRTVFL